MVVTHVDSPMWQDRVNENENENENNENELSTNNQDK
jgi:hypothetical protein